MTQLLKAIAIYTFLGLWADKAVKSKKVTVIVLAVLWSFISVMVIIGFTTNTNFFAPTPVSDFSLYLVVVLMQCNRSIGAGFMATWSGSSSASIFGFGSLWLSH